MKSRNYWVTFRPQFDAPKMLSLGADAPFAPLIMPLPNTVYNFFLFLGSEAGHGTVSPPFRTLVNRSIKLHWVDIKFWSSLSRDLWDNDKRAVRNLCSGGLIRVADWATARAPQHLGKFSRQLVSISGNSADNAYPSLAIQQTTRIMLPSSLIVWSETVYRSRCCGQA